MCRGCERKTLATQYFESGDGRTFRRSHGDDVVHFHGVTVVFASRTESCAQHLDFLLRFLALLKRKFNGEPSMFDSTTTTRMRLAQQVASGLCYAPMNTPALRQVYHFPPHVAKNTAVR